jgi:hypothetical protein
MKKRIIAGIIATLIGCVLIAIICETSCVVAGHSINKYTKEELVAMIDEAKATKDHAHTMAESARALGWENNDKLIKELQEMWHEADEDQVKYQGYLDEILANEAEAARKAEEERLTAEAAQKAAEEEARRAEEAKWAIKAAEYPAAT